MMATLQVSSPGAVSLLMSGSTLVLFDNPIGVFFPLENRSLDGP